MEDISKIIHPIFSTPQLEEAIKCASEEYNVSFTFALQLISKFSIELAKFRYTPADVHINSIIQQYAERHGLVLDPSGFHSSFDNEED